MTRRAGGFTLIETLLVVALVALLVALSVPALARVRVSAFQVASLANLRSNAAAFAEYANDWDDALPQFAYPDATYTVLHTHGMTFEIKYFFQSFTWPFVMADSYLNGSLASECLLYPGMAGRDDALAPTYYYYSPTLITTPAFWDQETRTGPDQWRCVRLGRVRFPAAKALLVEADPVAFLPTPAPPLHPARRASHRPAMAFLDGHAERFDDAVCGDVIPTGEGPYEQALFHIGIYGMHTVAGINGRDKK